MPVRQGTNVEWDGSVTGEEKRRLFEGCDLGIVPSVWAEPGGPTFTMVEWLAAGRPVLASNRGGLGEVVGVYPGSVPVAPTVESIVDSVTRACETSRWPELLAATRSKGSVETWNDGRPLTPRSTGWPEVMSTCPARRRVGPDDLDGVADCGRVDWNLPDHTARCVAALKRDGVPASRIVLVENGRTARTWSRVSTELGDCVLVRIDVNVGFARANNIGARALPGKAYILVNNDASSRSPEAWKRWCAPSIIRASESRFRGFSAPTARYSRASPRSRRRSWR